MTIDALERKRLEDLCLELNRADQDLADQAYPLAVEIMKLTTESGHNRLVVGAALWRAVAGFYARLALDTGDRPEVAGQAVVETAFIAAGVAEELAQRELARRRQA